ncbi:hypothetical protein [Methylorubrum podarium]|jgi:hypothetical protein|uniref:hypothetical protein n=1 Tax=Methylorubrum podarium TaxID=200476 RepID=UPI001EE1A77B|nr:hypothetical protein [Methylorubrum podarium]GJE70853.1 hypothetical protein CHKEEEPN_2395 [Methylorubrum podarium]
MAAPLLRPSLFPALAVAACAVVTLAAPAQAGGNCVSAECYRRVVTPPVYDTVAERVLVQPPRTVYRTTPPVYDTVSERVLVAPGGRRWETRVDAYGQLVGCWVTTPPRYAVQTRRVLVRPPEAIPHTLPPVYATTQRRVLVQPARAAWVPAAAPVAGPAFGPGPGYGPLGIGSIPDALGITGASSADVAVGLGFSQGSIYDGY